MKPRISKVIIMGDSLSDRGTFLRRDLLGLVPFKRIPGLAQRYPNGRFTNAFVWGDYLAAMMANKFIIQDLKKAKKGNAWEMVDATLDGSLQGLNAYHLNDDQRVNYHKKNITRNYTEAGLTASDYHGVQGRNVRLMFFRNMVATLDGMRQKLIQDDKAYGISAKEKQETLIIEWAGANDILIANDSPSFEIVDRAVVARVENIKKLIEQGYRNFMSINLPNFILTPRYQNKSKEEQDIAKKCCDYFNLKLTEALQQLKVAYPTCCFDEFNINELLMQGYEHPEDYGLEKEKRGIPYIKSPDFLLNQPRGYIFCDDLHFMSRIHYLLGERILTSVEKEFEICEPEKEEAIPAMTKEAEGMGTKKMVGGVIAGSAVALGLNKLGVSGTTIATGLGLAACGFYAQKRLRNSFGKGENSCTVQYSKPTHCVN